MQKSPDQVKKGVKCCAASYADCHKECPYKPDCDGTQILKDALALIQQLQADNAQQVRCIENMTDKLNAMNDEVVKLQAERDAAVADIKRMVHDNTNTFCYYCEMVKGGCEAVNCRGRNAFEWRGVQKEE